MDELVLPDCREIKIELIKLPVSPMNWKCIEVLVFLSYLAYKHIYTIFSVVLL